MISQWLQQAFQLQQQGRFAEAAPLYGNILRLQPNHFDALQLLGALKHRQGQLAESDALFRQALKINARNASVQMNYGHMLLDYGRPDDALTAYDKALKLKSAYPEAHHGRGLVLTALLRYDEAVKSFGRAIALKSDYAEAYNDRGNVLRQLRRFDAALADYEKAVDLSPGFAFAHNNLGVTLQQFSRLEDACARFTRAVALDPGLVAGFANLADVLRQLGRWDDALAACNSGLALSPYNPETLLARSLIRLSLGEMPDAWKDYDGRLQCKGPISQMDDNPAPVWCGEPLQNKRIVVYEEQGFGDTFQFSRYLPLLVDRGADVTFFARPALNWILRQLGPTIRLIDWKEPLTETFDFQCPLMSLPHGFQTRVETIPVSIPYFHADSAEIERWRAKLGGDGFKIGIVWQGNPDASVEIGRSFPLADLAAVAEVQGVRLISLQMLHGLDQLTGLPPDMRVETLGPEFNAGPDAFADTAAVMASLDLIMTCDTAAAHLAGALGRPVWLAVNQVSEWRWLRDRCDSPWYPTMRIYRQSTRGDWRGVFERMAADLCAMKQSG